MVPNLSKIKEVEFEFDTLVKTVIENLLETTKTTEEKHGLYYKKVGLWLDETKPMVAYDIFDSEVCVIVHISNIRMLLNCAQYLMDFC